MMLENTRYIQYVAAFTGSLTMTSAILYATWTSPILPKIEAGDSPLGSITLEQRSWIVSSLALGHLPGSLIAGWSAEKFGRRGSLLLSSIPILLPWYIISYTSSVWIICIVRFIAGLAVSNAIGVLILYITEIADKDIRGRLGSLLNVLALTGEMIAFCVGPYVSYLSLTLISSTVPLIFLATFYFMPETPYYLAKMGKDAEAKHSLKRLLRNDVDPNAFSEQMELINSSARTDSGTDSSFWEFISNRRYRRVLFIALGIQILHQFSGLTAILAYMQTIIGKSQSSISPEISSMICGMIQFPVVFAAGAVVDRAGRKPLLIISSLGCAFALLIEGTYFYLQDVTHTDTTQLAWMPTTGLLLYLIMRPVGIGTVTLILIGELFPTNMKGHGVSTAASFNNILSFMIAKSFEPVSHAWGMHVMFVLFATVCVLGALFVYFIVPETKGKTFAEISEKLNGKKTKFVCNAASVSI